AMNPEEFGFEKPYTNQEYLYDFEVVDVDGLMPLEELAKAASIPLDDLKALNPELLRWATPPGDSYPLKIPAGIEEEFLAAYQEIPKENRAQEVTMHTVSRGESLGYIANRYGTSVGALYASNENLNSTIYPGQRIMVPVAGGSPNPISADRPSNSSSVASGSSSSSRSRAQAPPNTSSVTYTVKSGDTIGHIAEWHDVRAWQIRSWNGIGNTIRVGQRLTIHVQSNRGSYYNQIDGMTFAQKQELERRQRAGEDIFALRAGSSGDGEVINYTVRRNDTLTAIAQRHGVSISAIQKENNMSGTRIYAGQTLKIRR
ncbi:MAG TPA: LysM peptidoglycan-binding domain-containing protein, partial [Balneolaceae bacterium]|nr:LysM peptidoglycan-binding domain-containing protein [Balneolaceae bacterium]